MPENYSQTDNLLKDKFYYRLSTQRMCSKNANLWKGGKTNWLPFSGALAGFPVGLVWDLMKIR